ncbi:MAG TPA: efflux RND transporter periplasmic adaptor subunit, partial [Planctomycetaceae bacterium]|nr:efflux RND transporter periplasmic adaptor subunit [Planctomycetaceae bacterium]
MFIHPIARCFPVLLNAILAASVLLPTGCSRSATQAMEGKAGTAETDKSGGAPPAPPPALVRAARIRQDSIAMEFRALGNVRPRHMSVVASGADGIVAEFPVEVGDFVNEQTLLSQLRMESTNRDIAEQEAVLKEREAVLAEISTPRKEDQDEARARKSSADVAFASAERRLEELLALSKRGAAKPSEVKDAQESLDDALQTRLAAEAVLSKISNPRPEVVRQAQARLEAQQMHVSFLEAERDKRTTKAPFAGFVVEEHSYVGEWLSKGAPVVTLAQLDEVEVEVQIDQQYIDQIVPGRAVTLQIQGSGSQNGLTSEWKGVVDSVVPRSNWRSGSRSFPVIVRIKNEINTSTMPPVPALREGMMAEATFQGKEIEALLVPKDSMVRGTDATFIFVINPPVEGEPLSVRRVAVTMGLSSGTSIQVIGDNIAADMQVVTEGVERLQPFKTVVILP